MPNLYIRNPELLSPAQAHGLAKLADAHSLDHVGWVTVGTWPATRRRLTGNGTPYLLLWAGNTLASDSLTAKAILFAADQVTGVTSPVPAEERLRLLRLWANLRHPSEIEASHHLRAAPAQAQPA